VSFLPFLVISYLKPLLAKHATRYNTELNSEEDGRMSPELLKILSTVHTWKKFMLYTKEIHDMDMDVMRLRVARQLVHYREFRISIWDMENVVHVFAFLAAAWSVIQVAKVELTGWSFGVGFVDALLRVGCW
jgi:hypothetical protein